MAIGLKGIYGPCRSHGTGYLLDYTVPEGPSPKRVWTFQLILAAIFSMILERHEDYKDICSPACPVKYGERNSVYKGWWSFSDKCEAVRLFNDTSFGGFRAKSESSSIIGAEISAMSCFNRRYDRYQSCMKNKEKDLFLSFTNSKIRYYKDDNVCKDLYKCAVIGIGEGTDGSNMERWAQSEWVYQLPATEVFVGAGKKVLGCFIKDCCNSYETFLP